MLTRDLRQTIHSLHKAQKSNREIGRLLKVSKSTVANILKQGVDISFQPRKNKETDIYPLLTELFTRCLGNAVRIKEVLGEEYAVNIGYTTLKRYIQNAELRAPLKRVGEYCFNPGEEMQHDTSPHWVLLGDKKIKVQCASLVLG